MAASLFILPSRVLDENGSPFSGAKLFTYVTGTTTPQAVYTDAALTVPHANPVVADSGGKFPSIFFDASLTYRAVIKNATGSVTLHDIDPANEGSFSFLPDGSGGVERSVADRLNDTVHAPDLGIIGDDATDNTATLAAAMARFLTEYSSSVSPRIYFPPGIYRYATSPNFAVTNLHIDCAPGVVFKHTGSGVAFNIDGGVSAAGGDCFRLRITGQPTIFGNASTTYGVDMRGLHHSHIELNAFNASTAAFRLRFGVATHFWLRNSGLGTGGQTTIPPKGLILDRRDVGEDVTDCTFYTPIIEQCSNVGIHLIHAGNCSFYGGTSEANTTGNLLIDSGCTNNWFYGLDSEFAGTYDISCAGAENGFVGCFGDKLITLSGTRNVLFGGRCNAITVTGAHNSIENVSYSNAVGAFTDSGTLTRVNRLWNLATGAINEDQLIFPYGSKWIRDTAGNDRFLFGAAETYIKTPNGQIILRNSADAEVAFLGSLTGAAADARLELNNVKVLGAQGAAVADATDAASTMARLNDLLARLRAHGIIAT